MDPPLPSDLPPDVITTIVRRFEHLSTVAMHNVFGKMPYQWQLQIICHLSLMKTIDASICPGAVLLPWYHWQPSQKWFCLCSSRERLL
jgi:hypothetical protein